jgi:triacylglycerol lipase
MHGLLDTPAVFNPLKRELAGRRDPLLIPAIPLRLGRTPVMHAAEQLANRIESSFGREQTIDVLGFSMGGVIARCWIQLMGGATRVRRFISVGSPQQGTITARPWPRRVFRGIADLQAGSALMLELNRDLRPLQRIDCLSFYSPLDLVVLPGWRAVLPVGPRRLVPVLTHPQLLWDQAAVHLLARELLRF